MIQTSDTVRNVPLAVIQSNCNELASARAKLRAKNEQKQKAIQAVDLAFDGDLRKLQDDCNACRAALLANLQAGRILFIAPKTREFAGITVGFEKQRNKVVTPDDAVLVDRIEKMLPKKQADTLLDRSVAIIKNAFKKLPRETLQKLGCSFLTGADEPVIRANDDDIEDLVKKALGGSEAK